MPLRDHLETLHRQTGIVPDQLANAPDCPEGCETLWGDFIAMHNTRGMGMSAPMRISFHDIDAYSRVNRIAFEAWEIAAIRAADNEFISHWAETRK